MANEPFLFAGELVAPGSRRQIPVPLSRLPTGNELAMEVDVLHGASRGPSLWLSGAIHGDEIVGVEVIRRVVERIENAHLAGTIIAVPVVNVFGFLAESRYLPDRRDLNRSFPGSHRGSHAAQLARTFMDAVVAPCDIGVDFHAGSDDRTNLPQIRGNLDDAETRRLALAFAPPLAIHASAIKGSLREAAVRTGKRVLLFEGGEPRRFSPQAVDMAVDGTLRLLSELGMIDGVATPAEAPTTLARVTKWVRAPSGGIFRLQCRLGARVARGDRLGLIGSPNASTRDVVVTPVAGTVMGHAVNPLVHRGDGLVHIAVDADEVADATTGEDPDDAMNITGRSAEEVV